MSGARAFDTLLIANRGEIAVRIARSARALGLRPVAVASDPDRDAPYTRACDDVVPIGGARPADSYLRMDKLIEAARAGGAQAIHPGYGFLAESAEFAQAVVDAGLVFVGPPARAIAAMGDKASARRRAAELGVPVLPGYDGEAQDPESLRHAARSIGLPLMIKAAAGGGGRGMRRVHDAAALDAALAGARSEALAAFGDGRLLLERALDAPRHVEIQVLADAHGHALFLGERDCSVQRRHQKIVEEAPCPVLSAEQRRAMGEAALRLARAIGYVGAGTVEFLFVHGAFTFMEMNTRLQVEHPVTEALTGIDLVSWQLRIAMGERLSLRQDDVLARFEGGGHAIEVRLCAEEPGASFLPRTGRVERWIVPEGVRTDHALDDGMEVSAFYDSLLGKVIAHAPTRPAAAHRLAAALDRTVAFGVPTNRAFLARLLRHPVFLGEAVSTALIDAHFADDASRDAPPGDPHWAIAAFLATRVPAAGAAGWPPEWLGWSSSGAPGSRFRLAAGSRELCGTVEGGGARRALVRWSAEGRDVAIDVVAERAPAAGQWNTIHVGARRVDMLFERRGGRIWLQADGIDAGFDDLRLQPALRAGPGASAGAIAAAMHGRVVDVAVRAGDRVGKGAPLATLEAMKMEHVLVAPAAGSVRAVFARAGEQVAAGRVLIELDLDGSRETSDASRESRAAGNER
jgi:geranyl-CoA carboxylase alpha subunit